MSNIKERKQLLVIELKDGTTLHSDKTLLELQQGLVSEKADFVMIDGVLFNKYEFKKAYQKKADNITMFKLSLSQEDQEKIRKREITMKELGKSRQDIGQIQRYLNTK